MSRADEGERTLLSPRFGRALERAHAWHIDHSRKGGDIPYVAHLLAVAALVLEAGGTEDHAIAALLHDAVEDRPERATFDAIGDEFGADVKAIVEACTDSTPSGERGPETWEVRKRAYVEHLRTASPGALLVSCADKLHNARALLRDLRAEGAGLWERFSQTDGDRQVEHYRAMTDVFLARLEGPGWLAEELDRVVGEIERLHAGQEPAGEAGGLDGGPPG